MGRSKTYGSSAILKNIVDLLLRPLMLAKPVGQPLTEWLAHCFGVEERPIRLYAVTRKGLLPGRYMDSMPTRSMPMLEVGDMLLMRFDDALGDKYEVEVLKSKREDSSCFGLTEEQWDDMTGRLFCLDGVRFIRGRKEYATERNVKRLVDAGCTRKTAECIARRYQEAYDFNFGRH